MSDGPEAEDVYKELRDACRSGDHERVASLVAAGADVRARDSTGWTALHHAAASGSARACEELLRCGAEVDARSNGGSTPLFYAARCEDIGATEALLSAGAKPDGSALTEAAAYGRYDQIVRLVESGVRPDPQQPGPLLHAVLKGESRCAWLLVSLGGVPAGFTGDDPHSLVWGGDVERLRIALRDGCDTRSVDGCGFTPLTLATALGSLEMVQALVSAGADPTALDGGGWSALEVAAQAGALDIVDWLLEERSRWCPVLESGSQEVALPLARPPAFGPAPQLWPEVAEVIVDRLRHPPGADDPGAEVLLRALYAAIKRARVPVVERLLRAGADGDALHPRGTPMLGHALFESLETAECLLRHGVNPDPMWSGARDGRPEPMLYHFVRLSRRDHVRLLLDWGADPDGAADPGEETPLMEALLVTWDVPCIRLLLEAGADPDRPGPSGETPRACAERMGITGLDDLVPPRA